MAYDLNNNYIYFKRKYKFISNFARTYQLDALVSNPLIWTRIGFFICCFTVLVDVYTLNNTSLCSFHSSVLLFYSISIFYLLNVSNYHLIIHSMIFSFDHSLLPPNPTHLGWYSRSFQFNRFQVFLPTIIFINCFNVQGIFLGAEEVMEAIGGNKWS